MTTQFVRRHHQGFTLIEVLVAAALLGASLVVMFGFHTQAVRSNMNARRLTDCTYLAQTQMEELLALDWNQNNWPDQLKEGAIENAEELESWADLEWPEDPELVNAANTADSTLGPLIYKVTWDVEDMDGSGTWLRLRVRCQYEDAAFDTWHGTTISSYRFRDW